LQTLGAGKLTPSQAAKLLAALAGQARLVEIDDMDRRITELEKIRNDNLEKPFNGP
jgi:hypothetical protein